MVVFLIKKGGPKNFIQLENGVSTIFTCTNGPLSIPTNHIKTNSRLNWIFEEKGKLKHPEKTLMEQRRELKANQST